MTTPTSLQTSTSSLSLSLSSSSHGHLTHAETQLLDCLASFPNHQATTDAVLDQLKPMDMTTLAMLMNGLLNKAMIDMKKNGQGQLMMTLVKLDEKQKMDELENEEKLVYSFIKQVGTQGIWVRTLANRTNLHQSILNKALKKLEQRQLVKTVKSVKLGNKKLYMLYELEPSKEVTGGIWFSDQALDIDFVETIARTCLRYIQQHSFPPDPLSIYPMTYPGYPTLTRITHYISTCKVANVDLTTTDIQMVLNTLLFDGLIETMAPIRKGEGRRRGPKVDEENGGRPPLLRFPSSSSSTTSVRFSTKAMGTTAPSFPYNHDAHDDDDDEEEEEDFEIDELRYRATREHRAIPRPGLAKVGSLLHAMSLAQPHVHERTTGVSGNGSSSDSTPLKASNPLIPDGQTYLNRWADY